MDEVMTWPIVWDDAIKIGLGALIGALSVYFTARQGLKLQLRGEYAKRRRDALEQIAPQFDALALQVYTRAIQLSGLPYGGDEQTFKNLYHVIDDQNEITIAVLYEFHAIEARLALLAFPDISEQVEEFREWAAKASICEPVVTDSEASFAELSDRILKQRTLVASMMAVAYRDA